MTDDLSAANQDVQGSAAGDEEESINTSKIEREAINTMME